MVVVESPKKTDSKTNSSSSGLVNLTMSAEVLVALGSGGSSLRSNSCVHIGIPGCLVTNSSPNLVSH